ncbi:hypothetical protein A2U01_0075241, partial [Trifolium medium]|nr:hypothetical protein [Trifolium medium]
KFGVLATANCAWGAAGHAWGAKSMPGRSRPRLGCKIHAWGADDSM